MALNTITQPVEEPITLAQAKEHCRPIGTTDDNYITALIAVARRSLEISTRRAFIEQTLEATFDRFPCSRVIRLERPKLISVTSITYVDAAGDTQTLAADRYTVDTKSEPGRVILNYGDIWPATGYNGNTVTITYKAGYGDAADDVEPDLRHAVKFLVGHLYANREPVAVGVSVAEIPKTLDYLWQPHEVHFNGN